MNLSRIITYLVSLLLLSGCSGTYHAYYQSLKLAFAEDTDPLITLTHVQNSASDLLEVKKGEQTKAIMALAYIEAGQFKWISADQAMLIFEQGRIVRTLGFTTDLIHLSNKNSDPLKYFAKNSQQQASLHTWIRKADWSTNEFGYKIVSSFRNGGDQVLNILSAAINTRLIIEDVQYLAPANFLRSDDTWKNYYWFETKSGQLVKSIQTLSPLEEQLEMVYLSRVARLLPIATASQENL